MHAVRHALVAALVLLAWTGPTRSDPDDGRAEFESLAAAAKANHWEEAGARATALLDHHPGSPFEGPALFVGASAAWHTHKHGECAALATRYLLAFPGGEHAEALGARRCEALFRLAHGIEAKAAIDAFLRTHPSEVRAARARDLLDRIDPSEQVVHGSVVLDYVGKYAGDPRFAARIAEVEQALPKALHRVRARLGLADDATVPFRVRFRDAGERPDSNIMKTVTELIGATTREAILVRTERLVVGYDVATVLTHELTHVWQRTNAGVAIDDVPTWMREASAMWVAEQSGRRLTTDLWSVAGVAGTDPAAALLDGLGGRHATRDYTEDALAFDWLEATKGADVVRALVRKTFAPMDAESAFAAAAGMSWPEARDRARAWSAARIRAAYAGHDGYFEARRALAEGRRADAVAGYDAFLAASPDDPYVPKARMDRAVALARTGHSREALAVFAALEASPFADTFELDILEQRARIAAAHQDLASVEASGARILRDFSWVDPKRLAAIRALWEKAGGSPPAPPPPAPTSPPDGEEPDEPEGGG